MIASSGRRPTAAPVSRPAPGRGRVAAVVLGAVAAIAVLVAVRADSFVRLLPNLSGWDVVIAEALSRNQDGVWRLMRGAVKYLLAPALGAAAAWSVLDLLARRRPRSATIAVVVAVGAFGTVEVVKAALAPVPGWAGSPLTHLMSGHVAAAAAATVPVLVAARGARRAVAVPAVVVVAGTAAGVVLARWHTVADGLASMVVVALWAAAAVLAARLLGAAPAPSVARGRLWAAAVGLTAAAALVLAMVPPASADVAAGMAAAGALLVGAGATLVAAGLELGATLASSEPGQRPRK